MGRYCLLRMIDPVANNNKDYEMIEIGGGKFEARYGRVKSTKQVKVYSLNVWDESYSQKIRKGYIDITDLNAVNTVPVSEYREIEDSAVRALVNDLLRFAKEYVKQTYSVERKDVTPAMISKASECLKKMAIEINDKDVYQFNKYLTKLFVVIPRKMKNVADYLATSVDDMQQIYDDEEKTLATLKSVVDIDDSTPIDDKTKKTILEAFGLKIRPCSNEEVDKIKEKMTAESAKHFRKAFRVELDVAEKKHAKYMEEHGLTRKNEHFLYHGTKNQNVWSILKTSLSLNPNAPITGKMFGYGLYFAPKAYKSLRYVDIGGIWGSWNHNNANKGYLFVFKVAYKNPYHTSTHEHRFTQFTERDMQRMGTDAFFAHAGNVLKNDEIIVYNEAAVVPRYLIEVA